MKSNTSNEAASGSAGKSEIIQFGKGKKNETGCRVLYDEDTETMVSVTPETQKRAAYVHQQALMGVFISAFAVQKMFDERLYLGLGYQSREEYTASALPFGQRQAERYYKIASKFDNSTKLLTNGELTPIDLSNGSEFPTLKSLGENENLAQLGINKLLELSQLEDDEVAELIKNGKVNLAGGELTIKEILESTTREMAKKIAGLTKKYQSKISQISEELKLRDSEDKDTRRRMDELLKQNEFAKKIEEQLGPVASTQKVKYERLASAEKLLTEFSMTLRKCGVTADDPKELQDDLCALLKKADSIHEEMCVEFGEVVEAAV